LELLVPSAKFIKINSKLELSIRYKSLNEGKAIAIKINAMKYNKILFTPSGGRRRGPEGRWLNR
jgi:hypothetical protein